MKIHGDLKSGNCLKVKWTADLLGLAYTWVPVDIMKGEQPHGRPISPSSRRARCRRSSLRQSWTRAAHARAIERDHPLSRARLAAAAG